MMPRVNRAPISVAVTGVLVLALGLAVALAVGAAWAITWPEAPSLAGVPTDQRVGLLQLALAAAAFVGGVVALTVAYRKQRVAEAAHDLTVIQEQREDVKVFNERFGSASAQLGHDRSAVRLAGVYAIAGLADDWLQQRQTCVDVLCAYMRMPYDQAGAPPGEAEVRRTIMWAISSRLRPGSPVSWVGLGLDFTGAVLESPSFVDADFRDSVVLFNRATFIGGRVTFYKARFRDASVFFRRARFLADDLSFEDAEILEGSNIKFEGADLGRTPLRFTAAQLRGGRISLVEADLERSAVIVSNAAVSGTVFAHSANWEPPAELKSHAVVETLDDLWQLPR